MLGLLTPRRVFYILILVAIFYAASQYLPAYFYALQFKDFIRQEVKYAGPSRKSMSAVISEILDKAKEFDIPITDKDVRITRRGPSFTLDLDYQFPIDLRIYRHELTFHASETGESFEK